MMTILLAGWFAWMGMFIDGTLLWNAMDTEFQDQESCETMLRALAHERPDITEGTLRVCLPEGVDANEVPVKFGGQSTPGLGL